jgi:6,7-dimethyl-8-ribityllumazine synthase
LVASQFHASITQALVDGARGALARHGVPASQIRLVWVPGAFELPVAALTLARRERPEAIVALGCVLKGETPQYAAIGQAVANGLTQVALATETPVTFGVIIAESPAQARARAGLPAAPTRRRKDAAQAGGRAGNRGSEAALAALALIALRQDHHA